MDQSTDLHGYVKPLGGFIVVLTVALFVGGWLYVDAVRNELDGKIEALTADIAAVRMEAKGEAAMEEKKSAPTQAPSEPLPVFSSKYGFALTTAPSCEGQFVVREDPKPFPKGAEAEYEVFVPKSKRWPANESWYSYVVMSQGTYDALPGDELPGKPSILAVLKDGLLLTRYSPQDGPDDLGNCELTLKLTP